MRFYVLFPILVLVLLTSQNLHADVYSRVNSKALISGTSDCYLINYSLWESHGTTNPADDTHKGTYNAVVGTDCPIQITPTDPIDLKPDVGSIDQKNDEDQICVYPNPSSNELKVAFPIEVSDESKWTWSLISFDNVEHLSGNHIGKTEFSINTNALRPGRYLLVLVSDKNEMKYSDITIIR